MIADDPKTMGPNNDNDHSFNRRQLQQAQQNRLESPAAELVSGGGGQQTMQAVGGGGHELDERRKRNEWGLMQIVESAESKLMRKKLVAGGGGSAAASVGARRLAKPSALQLLKSPTFATNTLDEQELDQLADENPLRRRRQQQQQQLEKQSSKLVSDCISQNSSTTNMINRRHHDGDEHQDEDARDDTERPTELASVTDAPARAASRERSASEQVHLERLLTAPSSTLLATAAGHDDDGERGGPTPTNDLIRALIQRDRSALRQPPTARGCGAIVSDSGAANCCNTEQTPRKGGGCGGGNEDDGEEEVGESGNALRRTVVIREAAGGAESATRHARGASHSTVSAGCGAMRNVDGFINNSSIINNHGDQLPGAESRLATTTTTNGYQQHWIAASQLSGSPANSAPASATGRRQSGPGGDPASFAFELPALIQHHLQVSPASVQPHSGRAARCDQRQASDATGAADGQRETPPRRHSIYMLPMMLNKTPARHAGEDADSEGDDADAESDTDDTDADDELLDARQRRRQSHASGGSDSDSELRPDVRSARKRNGPGGGSSNLFPSSQLRMSASSPSALSTPTNQDGERVGCGGPCCKQSPLQQVAAAGARHHQHQQQVQVARSGQHQAPGVGWAPRASSLASKQRRYSLAPILVEGCSTSGQNRVGEQRRQRINSNPLDRFRLVGSVATGTCLGRRQSSQGDSARGSLISLNQQQQHQQVKSHQAAKRLSMISSGSQFVSKLSHPRSLFSSSAYLHQHQRREQQHQRGSVDQCYDPLIPESGFKIVVMGTSGSGKTSIIQRFMYNTFNWRHNPTVEDTYFIEFPHMKNVINISISDTSGTYQFPAMRRLAINSGDAFILVYSVENPQSFDDLEQLRQTILDEREQAYLEASASTTSDESNSGLATNQSMNPITNSAHTNNHQLQLAPSEPRGNLSPRHWSLASIFNSNHQQQEQQHHHHHHQLGHHNCSMNPSLSSSMCSSSSCSSSAENSRRSSISAAEAALKTRRTRRPPMVIVANKHDLPVEQHLVNSDEIEALAVIDWNNGFVRASAALNLNIDEIFQQVLKQARQPPTLTEAIVSKRRKSLPPKLPNNSNTYIASRKDYHN